MSFPTTPTAGDTFIAGGRTYVFGANGAWSLASDLPNNAAGVLVNDGTGSLTWDATIGNASWTTATRPATPTIGQRGFNTDLGAIEVWDGTSWGAVGLDITGLTAETALAADDEIAVYDASTASNRKATISNIAKSVSDSTTGYNWFVFG